MYWFENYDLDIGVSIRPTLVSLTGPEHVLMRALTWLANANTSFVWKFNALFTELLTASLENWKLKIKFTKHVNRTADSLEYILLKQTIFLK